MPARKSVALAKAAKRKEVKKEKPQKSRGFAALG